MLFFFLSFFESSSTFQQAHVQNWTPPSTGENLAGLTVWAMRFTSCVTLVMNFWDQRAGYVRKVWPGAASRLVAEVRELHWSPATPQCGGHFLHCLLLILISPVSHLFSPKLSNDAVIYPTDRFYNPVIIIFVTFPSPALCCHFSLCASWMSPTFFHMEIHFMWAVIIFPLYVLWSMSRELIECTDTRYSKLFFFFLPLTARWLYQLKGCLSLIQDIPATLAAHNINSCALFFPVKPL